MSASNYVIKVDENLEYKLGWGGGNPVPTGPKVRLSPHLCTTYLEMNDIW